MLYTRQRRAEVGLLPIDGGFVPRRDNPVAGLLGTAWAHFDHTSIVGSNPVTEWQDVRGTAARDLDVVVGTGANLITLESGVALLTGTAGDNITTPDAAGNQFGGDTDFRVRGALTDWTPAADMALVSKQGGAAARSYSLTIQSGTGKFVSVFSLDGTATNAATSSVAPTVADGVEIWSRVTRVSATGVVQFFISTDDVEDSDGVTTWTQVGNNQATNTGALSNEAVDLEIGTAFGGTVALLNGKVRRVQLYDTIDGSTPTVDMKGSDASVNTATFTSGGVVWTANGDAFVNATRHTGIYSRGSVGLETTAGQTITGTGITVYAVFKPTLAAPGADQFIFDAKETAGESVSLRSDESNSDKYTLNQGSDIALTPAYDNDLQVFTAQILGTASTKLTASAGSVTGDAGSENFDFGSIFMALGAGSTTPGLFLEFQIYNTAHSAGEISLVRAHLAAKFT